MRGIASEEEKEKRIQRWFYGSLAVAAFVAFASAWDALGSFNPLRSDMFLSWAQRNHVLVGIILDAMFWQLLTAIVLFGALILRYWNEQAGWRKALKRLLALTCLMVIVFVVCLRVEKVALKPALLYLRSGLSLPEGFISSFGHRVFTSIGVAPSQSGYTAAPSGVAIRQALLFLSFCVYAWIYKKKRQALPAIGFGLLTAFSIATLASRVLIGAHSIRDMGLGVSIGIIGFWLVYALRQLVGKNRRFFEQLLLPAGTSTLAILFYCHDPLRWMQIVGVVLAGSFTMYYIFIIRRGLHREEA